MPGQQNNAPSLSALQAQNLQARQLLIKSCVDSWQQIFSQTYTSNVAGTVVNVPLRNVGLIKRLVVQVSATVSGTASHTTTLTALGGANFFSQVVLTDLSNQTRINTTGWHLTAVASAKMRTPLASAIKASSTDNPFGYGVNYTNVQTAPATITASASSDNVFLMFEIPVAYSDFDLRGAIYANVVNATLNLQLTINPNLIAASTVTDAVFSMYQAGDSTAATITSATITVYQNYLDQIPVLPGKGPVLPLLDLSTAYLLNNTSYSGLTANQDNPLPYANFRDFMSTTLIYDNAGTLNAGSDITSFAIQSANYTNIIKHGPQVNAYWNRNRLRMDMIAGGYYWDHRNKPISTVQYGNMALVVNPSSVSAGAYFAVGYESLALINQITNAGSISGT